MGQPEDFMPLDGWDHVELFVGNAKQAAYWYEHALGFRRTAYAGPETGVRDRASYVLEQGDIRVVVSSGLRRDSQVGEFACIHGDGVKDISLRVPDAREAYRQAVQRGARGIAEPHWEEDEDTWKGDGMIVLRAKNLAEARRSVWDLHPQYLDRHDLFSALSRMAAELGEATNGRIRVRTAGAPYRLSSDVERNLFRIAQEAVTNAIRHAAARQVDIEVRFDPDRTHVAIADDGRGFDPNAAHDGFGLTSMRERASQIGAALSLESGPSSGTRVTLVVPRVASGGSRVPRIAALARAARMRVRRLLS